MTRPVASQARIAAQSRRHPSFRRARSPPSARWASGRARAQPGAQTSPVMKPSAMIAITDPSTRSSVRRRPRLPVIHAAAYSLATRGLTLIVLGAAALLLGAGAAPAREAATRFVGNDAPNWSPDGKRIAFTAFRNGLSDIHASQHGGQIRGAASDDRSEGLMISPRGHPTGRRSRWSIRTATATSTFSR